MGKILDSLVRIMPHHGKVISAPHREAPQDPCETSADSCPFIEVGAPGKKIEASPEVLAVSVPGVMKEPAARLDAPGRRIADKNIHPVKVPIPELLEPKAKITLEAWPERPIFRVPTDIVAYHQPNHAASQEYASLCSRLQSGSAAPHILLFCGTSPDADTLTLVLNLAFHAAHDSGKRIVVVDADCEHAALAQATGLQKAVGLADVLAGKAALADALQATPRANLQALITQTGTEWSREALQWVFAWLRKHYDMMCVLGPAANAVCATLLSLCDDIYLVAAAQSTADASALAEGIASKGGNVRGVIKWV